MIEFKLKELLEREETETVGDSFGGVKASDKAKSFSVSQIRDEFIKLIESDSESKSDLTKSINFAKEILPPKALKLIIGNLIRFSFLIELTNLKVGSTKMKTRWLEGLILMPQEGSFEPTKGTFKPGNDPRSSSYDECLKIFILCINKIVDLSKSDSEIINKIITLNKSSSVPYEFIFDYKDEKKYPIHTSNNIHLILNEDIEWLLKARPIIRSILGKKILDKIQTKTYKTDRALTGKDKTNRAKRWEVLSDDFQHATISECWSVERKLYQDLIMFKDFPIEARKTFIQEKLIPNNQPITKCPVTYEELDYTKLTGDSIHGKAEYQVGHEHPLKRGGSHTGKNVFWQSADGNRIQGDLTIEETRKLLHNIFIRMNDNS